MIRQIHEKVVEASQQTRVVTGSKLRVDTTVVETNIHYPTVSADRKLSFFENVFF